MLNEDKNGAPRLADVNYIEPFRRHPERVVVEFGIDRQPNPDKYLVDKAANLLHGGTDNVAGIIESLATEHLRATTGTTARIHDDGYTIAIEAHLPSSHQEETVPSGHSSAGTTSAALTPERASTVPAVERALDDVLPDHHRQHANALAVLVAKELPTRQQVIEAYFSPTLEQVINRYHERYDPTPEPVIHPALKPYQLSFPHHPATALTTAPAGAGASPSGTANNPHAAPGLGC